MDLNGSLPAHMKTVFICTGVLNTKSEQTKKQRKNKINARPLKISTIMLLPCFSFWVVLKLNYIFSN